MEALLTFLSGNIVPFPQSLEFLEKKIAVGMSLGHSLHSWALAQVIHLRLAPLPNSIHWLIYSWRLATWVPSIAPAQFGKSTAEKFLNDLCYTGRLSNMPLQCILCSVPAYLPS